MVEGPGERDDALGACAAVTRLEADDAAVSGGPKDRANGLAADRDGRHAGGDGRSGTGGGAAWGMGGVPGIAGGGGIDVGELGGMGLAEDDRARAPERGYDGRVAVRMAVGKVGGAGACGETGDVDYVLDPDRHTEKAAAYGAALHGVVTGAGIEEGAPAVNLNPGLDL